MRDLIKPNLVADFLLCESRDRGEVLTNLKLQKLIYYAQAWHMALNDKALFKEDFQAWVHGPVLPSQYQRFNKFQWRPITDEIEKPSIDENIQKFLEEIIDIFGSETAVALELMTHREKPWMEARQGLPMDAISRSTISKETMKTFYKSLVQN